MHYNSLNLCIPDQILHSNIKFYIPIIAFQYQILLYNTVFITFTFQYQLLHSRTNFICVPQALLRFIKGLEGTVAGVQGNEYTICV